MLKFMSKIGDAAYKTAAKTGIAAGSEMPPYPCAVPLQVVDDPSDVELVESILDATYAGVQDLMGDLRMLNACDPEGKERPWKALDYTDSNGDIKLMSRKHMGPYNFARATMTFERVLPPQILSSMHSQEHKLRQQYSVNVTEYVVIARNPKMPPSLIGKDDDHLVELARDGIRDWHFEYNQYYAPPPVATRDFVYLVEKRYVAAEDAWYIYGTSIDVQTAQMKKLEMEKKSAKCVRGAVMFGWRLARVGADTKATYISCMNPNGWTPTFLLTWVQTEIAKEFQCARRLLYSTFHTRKDVVAAASSKRSYSQLRAPESSSTRIAENSKPVPVVSSSGDDVSTANDGDSRLTRSTMAISREDMAQDGFDAPRRLAHFDPVRIYPNLAADADVSKSCLSTTLSAELFERERVKAICAVAQWIAVQEPPVTAPAENVYRREAPRRCSVVSHGGLGSRTVSMESAVELCSCFSTFLEDGPITSPRVVEDRRTYAAEEELLLDSAVAL